MTDMFFVTLWHFSEMMGGYKFLFCYLGLVGLLPAVAANWKESLGKAYFLPDEDIYIPTKAGRAIFKELPEQCFLKKTVGETHRYNVDFTNTRSFYNTVSSDSGISINLKGMYTMGFTLGIKTKSVSSGSVDVRGRYTDIYNRVSSGFLNPDCYKGIYDSLTDNILKSIDSLPLTVNKPEVSTSWRKYYDFLKAYGSHIVIRTYFGSRIKQYTFSKMEKQFSKEQLDIRACFDFEGPTKVGKINTSDCFGITKEQVDAVKNLEISSVIDIRGGSDATRNQLQSERSEELITNLLNEARAYNETPIDYTYQEIWDFLRPVFEDDPTRYAKIVNMEQYFMGFLDFGCTLLEGGGLKLRRFELSKHSTTENPDYECVLERNGCHSDDDCHKGAFFKAFCYGSTCVEHYNPPFGFKAEGAGIRKDKHGGDTEGVNQSCFYQDIPIDGKCDFDRFHDKIIWDGVEHGIENAAIENSQFDHLLLLFCLCGTYILDI